MNFIKRVFSTVIGIFVFLFICFGFLILIGMLVGSSSDDTLTVRKNSILELKLDFPIKDYAAQTTFKDYPFLDENEKNGLFDLIYAIDYASTDENIKGVSIDNNFVMAGMSQTKALRDALLKFKESGKFIVSYGDVYSQKDYYLNSVADTLYINPVGILEFKGLSTERLYFKDFQEKSGIKMEVVRLGKYKSAVEPYLENEMSENNREQISAYLNGIWSEVKKEVSVSRNISTEQLNTIADNLLSRTPQLALSSGLIDKIGYHDEYIKGIKRALGVSNKKELNTILIEDYALYASNKKPYTAKDKIAVIYTEGQIFYGEGDETSVGQGAVNRSLEKARNDDKIKAIVLRVNSPGGSALASELIWREIELTKKVKPIIVSMGDVAASGGYYIACNANRIFAEPTTITGSIGVFGTLPNVKGLADKWGINAEQVVTNKNAVAYSLFEPMNDNQRNFIKESIASVYNLFTNRVAQGRNMTQEAVHDIAQGRVWTGADAVNNGLVDQLGGLDAALAYAAELTEVEEYRIIQYPVFDKNLKAMLKGFGLVQSKEALMKEELGAENYKILQEIKTMTKQKGIQLMFPFATEIK
ncbi:signal peptide peptidase SppA [Lacinutrix jangbogonensis]|uniref:signal peptide peptidase SppA n=1 Tax=Lacinutrix jangbogonensis TaxID=1469557 RepID=UPI00053DD242|nr:signal peptide peptidase SppA [Lacinutrix jangbogonensis]